ncbi:hypothetical protein MUK70_19170 [Dyadobacter chenwenxiniae]|uniref:Outer membrane protein beta-barrel domain-containing protein n=1 Tax=Dyadobacter chenwenxiniae TaxID=2906456 RepID=A0A9X1TKM5_9BACT|nr:hypothetical protein [Dyadobacter chenwenxiniae]MCF0061363.1 hypothetical protein [Dyadobacter chenwenxiniae]UON81185.1 hypothetical protein MUK70_19170 [Dyadobacter chenwenxiniae]
MKKIYSLILFVSCYTTCLAQVEGKVEITKAQATALGNVKNKGIKFGVSLGFNQSFKKLFDARISPIDTTLDLQNTSNTSFLLSSTLSFPVLKGYLGGSYYRKLDANGIPVGNPYYVPRGLSIIATINLATFNSALGGAGLFNQKLDGGLGIGYTFGDNVQIAATYEMLSFRQPRDYLLNYEGKKIIVNRSPLTSLQPDNNDFFGDKYYPSVSLKVIYTLTSE